LVQENVPEKRVVSIFRAEGLKALKDFSPEDGDSTLLRKFGFY
jgi:hypothetical protein